MSTAGVRRKMPVVTFPNKLSGGLAQGGQSVRLRLTVVRVGDNPNFVGVSGRQTIKVMAGGEERRHTINIVDRTVELTGSRIRNIRVGDELEGAVSVAIMRGQIAVLAERQDYAITDVAKAQ